MKKTRIKNIVRNIGTSLNRFLSIVAIVALGTGFLAGLESTTPDMEDAADAYMDKTKWYDIDVKNSFGFTTDDIDKLSAVKGVDQVQPAYVTDAVLVSESNVRYTTRIFGYLDNKKPSDSSSFVLLSGRMPERSDECVVQSPSNYTETLPAIGSKISFLNESIGYSTKSLTVTGIVKNPMFISAESEPSLKGSGSITLGVYVQKEFYTLSAYTDVFLTVKDASQLSTWSNEYKQSVELVAAQLRTVMKPIIDEKMASVNKSGNDVLLSLARVREVKKLLSSDEQNRIEQSKKVASILQYHGKNKLLANTILLTADAVNQTLKNADDYSFDSITNTIDEKLSLMTKKKDNLWSVNTRDSNTGYASFQSNIEKIEAMSKIFPVFFYFIAILVSLTTMTRLVEERRSEMGALKALGFSNAELLMEYLLYALFATLLGCVLGLVVGFKLFPAVISNAYGMMYSIPKVATPFRWNIALVAGSVAVVCILFATLAACFVEIVGTPALLMTPKAPAPGKRILLERISPIWKRIPFSGKVTARNLFRYKKRLYMTITGIAGCSALLVTGFGLHDSIYDIVDKQFGEINKYDLTVVFNDQNTIDDDKSSSEFFTDKSTVEDYMKISTENGHVMHGDNIQPTTIVVPEYPEQLDKFILLRERRSHKTIPFTTNGVVLTEKLCEQLEVKEGDFVTLENADGTKADVMVLGGAENYVYAFAYLCPQTYNSLFNKTVSYASALCNLLPQKNNDKTVETLMNNPSVLYVLSTKKLTANAYDTMRSINIVVVVLIISSGLLSMIVLYNLANINICERKRELATLLVLGYTERESRRYIFREVDILSFIGIALGLVLGIPLHGFIVKTLEVNAAMWGRTIYPLSFICAAFITVLFTFGVNLIMRKSINEINMVESMKVVD
jgi:putative ABC transport system permease protein